MQKSAGNSAPVRPANQERRIFLLRLAFLALLPLLFLTRSAWTTPKWIYDVFEVTGVFLVFAAVLGRFWSILYIGGHKNQTVMQIGPYSMCRHPLYLFSTIGVVGFGLMFGSIILALLLGGVTFLILQLTASQEEAHLRDKFGPAYDEYAARVPRILPKPSLFHTPPQVSFDVHHLKVNFFDALVFLSFIPIAKLILGLRAVWMLPSVPLF